MSIQFKALSSHRKVSRQCAVLLCAALGSILVTASCGISDSINNAVNKAVNQAQNSTTEAVTSLDEAISALQNQSADWQQVLQDLQGKLAKEAQDTLRNEVANLVSRSIAQGGVELRCDTDFIRDRVRQALIGIKASFLNQPVPAVIPGICQIVPVAVDRDSVPADVKQLEIYGYDFDKAQNLSVVLENVNGSHVDVTNRLDRPTHYAMTLKFGATGVQLDSNSQRFLISSNQQLLSTVGIIQPATPVCESQVKPISPGSITYVPPHIRGDADFYGHGPNVNASVNLLVTPQNLSASVYMSATEVGGDGTTAAGSQVYPLYTPDPGWAIKDVVGSKQSAITYTDNTVDVLDTFSRPAGEPVQTFTFVGDTTGDEAGTRTNVKVDFNQLKLVLVQNTGCVSDMDVAKLRKLSLISVASVTRLQAGVLRETSRRDDMMKRIPSPLIHH